MGGAPSRDLCQLTLGTWNWCIDCHITISVEHLPGSQNQVPDRDLCKASHLLQLEITSRNNSNECSVPTLGDIYRLCFAVFLHDRQVPHQDHFGKGPSDNPPNSSLEIKILVPSRSSCECWWRYHQYYQATRKY